MDSAIVAAIAHTRSLFERKFVPDEHGADHALKVLQHATAALGAEPVPPPPGRRLAVQLAALLHDADDRKYFPEGADKTLPNAAAILAEVLAEREDASEVQEYALAAIRLVSASGNGNSVPPEAAADPLLLYARWADRLEAVGYAGVYRCWRYTLERGCPLYLSDTPAPRNADEAFAFATPERFAAYQAVGHSESMLDHYFDKLLSLVEPLVDHPNSYISEAGAYGSTPLVGACVATRPEGIDSYLREVEAHVKDP